MGPLPWNPCPGTPRAGPALVTHSLSPPHLQLEEAAKEVADEVTRPRPAGDEVLQDVQVMLKSDASPSSIRSLKVGPPEGGGGGCVRGGVLERHLSASCATLSNSLTLSESVSASEKLAPWTHAC